MSTVSFKQLAAFIGRDERPLRTTVQKWCEARGVLYFPDADGNPCTTEQALNAALMRGRRTRPNMPGQRPGYQWSAMRAFTRFPPIVRDTARLPRARVERPLTERGSNSMESKAEELIRRVLDERDFEIRISDFCGDVAVTVLDENDPRGGCAKLRGEAGAEYRGSIMAALIEACEQALRDEYPQATACGRGIRRIGERWTNCVREKVHEGPCRDADGRTEM